MIETRAERYGRNLGIQIEYVISTLPKNQRENYKTKFLKEVKNYSFKSRKKGQPKNEGCVKELDDLENIDVKTPEDLAKLVKEGFHLMYQKGTSERVFKAMLKYLEDLS
ncbi:MAG: hypothetical protein PHD81_00020 [Candidatus Nanoarchaeia archaeon]|nr:hypothetical protein [Candidatus Nanoarchaeia archaeon]MDD5587478.1 hypothetical protein [Candidatus Nanoarchaeia archaeon]